MEIGKAIKEDLIDICSGCGEKIEGFDRWTSMQRIEGTNMSRLRFAHWRCIETGKCKWTPYS